jgi:hypothetical protein
VDENRCINTTIDAGSENKLNNKNISPLQWPNTPKRRVNRNRNTKNIFFVIRRRAWTSLFQDKEDKKGVFAKLEKKEDRRKRNEKTTMQVILVLKRQMIKGNEL